VKTSIIFLLISINIILAQDILQIQESKVSIVDDIGFISNWKTSGSCKSSFVSGDYAYITNNNKLEIVDVSVPTVPNLISQFTLNSLFLSEDIFGRNDYIYIANYKSIYVFDVSDPLKPDTLYSLRQESIINDISIVGDLLYVAASYQFYIYDISNPSAIVQLGHLTLPDASLGLTRFYIAGGFAYLCSWSNHPEHGLYVVDISNSEHPSFHGRFLERSLIAYVQDSLAYVANEHDLFILDISDNVIPSIIASRKNIAIPHDIYVDESFIYVSTNQGLLLYDKESLDVVNSYLTGDTGERLQIENGLTFVASNSDGLNILKVNIPTSVENFTKPFDSFKLEQNYPNPFNPTTTIKYSISNNTETLHAMSVQLKVYDILGEEVIILVNKNQKNGNYEVQFDASNLTSGIYYYKLSIGNELIKIKKMVLLK